MKQEMCLYDELHEVVNRYEKVSEAIRSYNSRLAELAVFQDFNLFDPAYLDSVNDVPEINYAECQRRLILRRIQGEKPNIILANAVERKCSIRKSLEKLAEINKSWRRFVPRRKNDVWNMVVDEMRDIVGTDYALGSLKTKGIGSLDNPITGLAYGILGGLGISALYISLYESGGSNEVSLELTAASHLFFSGFMGFLGAGLSLISRESNKSLPWNRADYIDNIIEGVSE